jgi:hypothetical protein
LKVGMSFQQQRQRKKRREKEEKWELKKQSIWMERKKN